ncbi:hypothetical protein BsWGS_28286 [Bradybaena similaris]
MALSIITVDGVGFDMMNLLEVMIHNVVPYQNMAAHSGLKTNKSQNHGPTASSKTSFSSSTSGSSNYWSGSLNSRSGSPNCRFRTKRARSESSSCRCKTKRARSRSLSSASGSVISLNGSPSSWSGSPGSKSRAPSSRRGSPSFSSESPKTEDKDLSGLVSPPSGIAEYYNGNEADIALGQNCNIDLELKAEMKCNKLLPPHIQDGFEASEDESCKLVPRTLMENIEKLSRKTDINYPYTKTAFDKDPMIIAICKRFRFIKNLFSKTAEDVTRKAYTYIDEQCRKTGGRDSYAEPPTYEISRKTAVEEVSHPTANEIIMSVFQDKSLSSHLDKYTNVADKSVFILSDTRSQPELDYSVGVISEQMQDKCHLATDRYEDCDKDHESSQTGHAECLIESLDDCKKDKDKDCVDDCMKKEVGDADEHALGNIRIHLNDNASLENGTGRKQATENMSKWLEEDQVLMEILEISQRLRSTFPFPYFFRKYFTKSESRADTEDDDVPCKNQGFWDVRHSEWEESCPECTEIYPSKGFNKAVAKEMSHKHYTCPHQRCSHRKRCTCLHKGVRRFRFAEVEDQDFEHSLGLLMRFDPVSHMPWRHYIQTYNQPSSVTSTLYIFMNFEEFRLSSFDLINFPKDDSSFVTNLAKSGFYFVSPTVQIICFGCGNKYERSQDSSASSADSFHHPQCTRHESNKPLDQSIQGLNPDALAEYFIQNGSLTPYLCSKILPSVADSSEEFTPKNVAKAGPVSDLQLATNDYSSGYESGGFQQVESEREAHPDTQRSANDSNTGDVEEQSEPDRSHLILTSATRCPVRFGSALSRYAEVRGDATAEGGAVGGIPILNLDSASYPQFSTEAVRRKSFTVWNPRHSHKPDDLAAAGFFYAGYSDCVRCFYCGLGLKFWRPEDIPAYQHARYRPHCQFNRLYKGQDYIDRVQQEQRSEQGATDIVETQTAPTDMVEVRTAPTHPQDSVQTICTSQVTSGPQELDFLNSEAARRALNDGWDRDQVIQAVRHIFSVYGEGCLEPELLTDILIHFSTQEVPSQNLLSDASVGSNDSGINTAVPQLTNSSPGSAILANALTVPDDGQDRQVVTQRIPDVATPAGTSVSMQPQARVPNRQDILTSVEREHTLLEERVTCRLCRSKAVGCIYLPCGHVIACQECADNATHCVVCSKAIIGTANIFLA